MAVIDQMGYIGEPPLYMSRHNWANLYQDYRIFQDRLELKVKFLLKPIIIQAGDIELVGVRKPPVVAEVLRGDHRFRDIRTAKLDLVDFVEHVAVVKRGGLFRQLRFSPHNPRAFADSLQSILPRRDRPVDLST